MTIGAIIATKRRGRRRIEKINDGHFLEMALWCSIFRNEFGYPCHNQHLPTYPWRRPQWWLWHPKGLFRMVLKKITLQITL